MITPDQVDFAKDGLAGEVGREVMDPWYRVPVVLSYAVKLPEISSWAIAPPGLATTWMGEECGELDRLMIPSSSRMRNSSLVGLSFSGESLRAGACTGGPAL